VATQHSAVRLTRRQLAQGAGIVGLALVAGCGRLTFQAGEPTKVYRIGRLLPGSPDTAPAADDAFEQGLREHGLIDGHNVTFVTRYAEGSNDRLSALAADLVGQRPDIIVVAGNPAARAASGATRVIPIVNVSFADPVAAELVASLARPGGNLTGLTTDTGPVLAGKRLELLKGAVPGTSRVSVLWTPDDPATTGRWSEMQEGASALGITLHSAPVIDSSHFDTAFEAILQARAQAVVVLGSPFLFVNAARIAEFALHHRLPSVATRGEFAHAGGLMAYGPDFRDLTRRAAGYVNKILKGAQPADLPIEQPREFELILNLKTARALGLAIPPHVLAQATEVLQ
jgi:putative ABC transport system substrate-binding protein